MSREPHPLRRHAIQIRRRERLLPIAREIAISEVIGEDEDDVGRRCVKRAAEGEEKEESHSEENVHRLHFSLAAFVRRAHGVPEAVSATARGCARRSRKRRGCQPWQS